LKNENQELYLLYIFFANIELPSNIIIIIFSLLRGRMKPIKKFPENNLQKKPSMKEIFWTKQNSAELINIYNKL
jgi:hypothetical protein